MAGWVGMIIIFFFVCVALALHGIITLYATIAAATTATDL